MDERKNIQPEEFQDQDFRDTFGDGAEFQKAFEQEEPAPAEPVEAPVREEKPVKKGRPARKKGYGLFGIPHMLSTVIWLAIILWVGVSLGRILWVCATDVLAFGREEQIISFTVEETDTLDDIAQNLKEAGLIRYPELFKAYGTLTDAREDISAGTFNLNTIYDYMALVNHMASHSSSREVVKVTIPEGYNCEQMFKLLEEKGVCKAEYLSEYAATGELDESGNPKYSYTVTYTPTSILQTADTIQIFGIAANNQEKLINTILVYPASTIYYEEGFLEKVSGWGENTGSKATMNQTFELLGLSQYDTDGKLTHFVSGKSYPYGYDPIYDGIPENGEVADSSISSNTVGDTARFTFTGTGFELYADCSQNSGFISVEILDQAGKPVKLMVVNTVVKGGNSGSTSGQSGSMGSLPIVSINNLEHDTYTVKLTKVMNDNKVVTIDGVRIFNTVADTSIYTIDLEDNPEFYQMRDAVLNAINIQDYLGDSMYQEDLDEGADQVLAGISGDSEAPCAIITGIGDIYTDAGDKAPQDMLDNGPKNEVYLWPGQTLTFNVKTNRTMQIGLKAPAGPTAFSANSVNSDDTDSASVYNGGAVYGETDMFYYLVNKPVENAENVYTVSVTNAGENILAVTNLKVCDDPSAALAPLTEENVRQILINAGYTEGEEPETPDEPLVFEDVPEDAYFHDAVVWAVKEKITNGMSATKFGPELNCTRAQAVTFLWSAAGKPAPTTTDIPFVDVAKDSYFYNAVLWAVENGITSGTDATHFSPEATCTRAQIVTFLYHAFDDPAVDTTEQPFSDVPVGAWCTAPITWAVAEGITSGVGDGMFGVNNICIRAQIVTFLYKAYN